MVLPEGKIIGYGANGAITISDCRIQILGLKAQWLSIKNFL
jgi:hypothetical protein